MDNVWAFADAPFENLILTAEKRKTGNPAGKSKRPRCHEILAFDIETSSIDYQGEPESFMYIWQLEIERFGCVTGRTWNEFLSMLDILKSYDFEIIILVHNLSYEFQFISAFLEFEDVFCMKPRKILYALHENIRFVCSYLHSNMNLRMYLDRWKVSNRKTELDYDAARYPWTLLTEDELEYCVNDVRGLVQAYRREMEFNGDSIYTTPLTSTGYVRRDVKRVLHPMRRSLLSISPDENVYKVLRAAFSGGNTHANRYYADIELENVKSYDRSSSYPEVQVNMPFPVSRFVNITNTGTRQVLSLIGKRAIVMKVVLKNLSLRYDYWGCPYLMKSKCEYIKGGEWDNGRVLCAEELEICITDIDFEIIKSEYRFTIVVKEAYAAKYGMLPDALRELIKYYYREKTSLKGVEGKEDYYAKFKNLINAIYGCSAQDPLKDITSFDDLSDELYTTSKQDAEAIKSAKHKATMPYQWGVWTTAHARMELERGIRIAHGHDPNTGAPVNPEKCAFVYCDTDSVKFLGDADFEGYNKAKVERCLQNSAYADDKNGKRHYLGVYEYEGCYEKFKTLGAKKYCYVEKGALHVTVAGVNKKQAPKELKTITNFKTGFCFKEAGGLAARYHDDKHIATTTIDGHELVITRNVSLVQSEYTIGLSGDYYDLLEKIKRSEDDVQSLFGERLF